jgi:hypothetical protein
MTRIFLSAAALSLAFAAPAFAGENARTFTRDGVTYTYTSTKTDGAVILEGDARPFGGKFRLVVRNGRVTGYAGNSSVSFRVAEARAAALQVAGR